MNIKNTKNLLKWLNPMVINSKEELYKLMETFNVESFCDRETHKIKELGAVLYKRGYKCYYLKLKGLSDKSKKEMEYCDMYQLVDDETNVYSFFNGNISSMFFIELED